MVHRTSRGVAAFAGLLLLVLAAATSLVQPGEAAAQANVPGELRARHSNKCLDVANFSYDHAARVIQGNCSGRWNQQWTLKPASTGYYFVVARHSNKCLDVAGYSRFHGAGVVQANCSGGTNQQWQFRHTDNDSRATYYQLRPRHAPTKCLDVAHNSIAHAARVIQGSCSYPGFNQQWSFVPKA